MKRLIVIVGCMGLALVACSGGASAENPVAWPTAVPPSGDTGGWGIGFQHEFPAGFWEAGKHRYAFLVHCPVLSPTDMPTEWRSFEVSEEAPLLTVPIYLRVGGLSMESLTPAYRSDIVVHPVQQTVAAVYFVDLPQETAERAATECEALFLWDDQNAYLLASMEPFEY